MAELEHEVTRAVEALRAKRSPPRGAKARVLAGVEARLEGFDPEPEDPEGGGSGPSDGGSLGGGFDGAFAAKVVGATLALTGGGLLTLRLGVMAVRSLAGAEPAELASVELVESAPATVIESEPPRDREIEALEQAELELVPEPAPARPSPKRPAFAPAPSEPAAAKSDMAAELALIDAAHRASAPEAAIAQLREHARRFPNGVLRDEREAMWAIASCELKDFAEAARRADALAARRPSSPLLDRVAKACPSVGK